MQQTKQQSSCPMYLSKCKALLKGLSIVHPTLQILSKVSRPMLHSIGEMKMLVCVCVCVCVCLSLCCSRFAYLHQKLTPWSTVSVSSFYFRC